MPQAQLNESTTVSADSLSASSSSNTLRYPTQMSFQCHIYQRHCFTHARVIRWRW
ncbi:MAG: hypothetical protein HC817_00570 [Saprospiraceae bacterium]|nr:hypothetical protein [Saprospiraceae bacterium]